MISENVRDLAGTAAVFGFFAFVWFGWAQEAPPRGWRPFLIAGSVAAVVIAVLGGLLTWRNWSAGTAFDEDTSRTFGIVAGLEFGAAALGAVLLAVRHRQDLTSVWIAFVVGVHLFPVAVLLEYPLMHVVAALVTIAAIAAVPIARARSLSPSAVVGAATGVVLLAAAIVSAAAAVISGSPA